MNGEDRVGTVCVAVATAVLLIAAPAAATPQHPTAASQQAPPLARPEKPGAAGTTVKGGTADGTAPSLEELAKRLSTVLAEQSARPSTGTATADNASAPGVSVVSKRPPTAVSRRAPAKKLSLVTLKWDTALTSGGVSLSWDPHLDPRGAHRGDKGVRLVWPDRRP
jgi:hypothetical protein